MLRSAFLIGILLLSPFLISNFSIIVIPKSEKQIYISKELLSENETLNYTIVSPNYTYTEVFDEYVEWEFNGTKSDFIVNYAYTLRVLIDENHTLVLEASKKTSVEDPNNSQASFDIVCQNEELDEKTIWSELHLWAPRIHINDGFDFCFDFKEANSTFSSDIITGNISIYPFIKWNFTYINIPLRIDENKTYINVTITNIITVRETEISLKTGVLIDFNNFNYSLLIDKTNINNIITFDTVLSYAYGVTVANKNASVGDPVYPSRIENGTIYYEYENLTFQTVNLNDTYYDYLKNGTKRELKAMTSIWYEEWTGTYEYHMDQLIFNETILTILDPEIKTYGDFRIFKKKQEETAPPSEEPAPSPSNPPTNENFSRQILWQTLEITLCVVVLIISVIVFLNKRRKISPSYNYTITLEQKPP